MAGSPFQTAGNVGDIASVQLKGGFTPDTGVVDAIVDVANIAIPLIQKNHENDLTNDVSGKAGAVSLALKATRFPSIQSSVFSEEALANPNVALALEEFTLIQDAVSQKRLPGTFALERLELIQNNAIRNAPEFESEIRGAMRDATGVDPQKALFSKLLTEATVSKTAEQRGFEKLTVDAVQLGISVEQMIGINQAAAQNAIAQQQFDLQAKQGTYTLNTAGSEVVNRGATAITNIMDTVQRMQVSGQPITEEVKRSWIAQVDAEFGAANAAMLVKTSGLNVSGTAINAELAPLNVMRETTNKMIADGTMLELLTQHNSVIIASTQNSLLNNPDYVAAYAIGGGRSFLDMVKFIERSGGTAKGRALVASLSGNAKVAFDLQNLPKQYSLIGSPEPVETRQEQQTRVIAAGVVLGSVGAAEDFQISALEDIKKYGGEELAWSSFGSNKVLTATATSNKLKAAFINIQATTTAGLSEELIKIASNPDARIDLLFLGEDGTLHFTLPPTPANTRGVVGAASVSVADTLQFVKRFNRANNISAKYHGAGVLPTARYGGTRAYWDVVKGAAGDIVKPTEQPVEREVIIGADGKLEFGG